MSKLGLTEVGDVVVTSRELERCQVQEISWGFSQIRRPYAYVIKEMLANIRNKFKVAPHILYKVMDVKRKESWRVVVRKSINFLRSFFRGEQQ